MSNDAPTIQNKYVFAIFCIWSFILLVRPQDLFPFLAAFRPAMTTGILTLLIVILNSGRLQAPPFFQERQVRLYTALVVVMILTIPFSLYRRLSFMVVFGEYINVILFFYIFYKVVDTSQKLYRILFMYCIGVGTYSSFALVFGSFGLGRLSFGSVFDPNDLAFLAVGFLPFNLIYMSRDNQLWMRLACAVSLLAGAMVIIMSSSRGGMLAFGISVVLMLAYKTKTVKPFMKIAMMTSIVLIVGYSSIDSDRFMTLLDIKEDYNVTDEEGRLQLWEIGVRSMISNPLTGVGVGCFPNAVYLDRLSRNAPSRKWQTAHNSLLQIGAENGMIGFALFLILSWNALKILNKIKKLPVSEKMTKMVEMGMIGFIGMFIAAMFLSQAYSPYWAFYIVFSAVVNQLSSREISHVNVEKTIQLQGGASESRLCAHTDHIRGLR